MKKTLIAFLLLGLCSCKKEQQPSIVGVWREISVYTRDNSGEFYWSGAPRFPYVLTLNGNGQYVGWNCVPANQGIYQYDPSSGQIRFEDSSAGIAETNQVSVLNNEYLVLDYAVNGTVEFRQKFVRVGP